MLLELHSIHLLRVLPGGLELGHRLRWHRRKVAECSGVLGFELEEWKQICGVEQTNPRESGRGIRESHTVSVFCWWRS